MKYRNKKKKTAKSGKRKLTALKVSENFPWKVLDKVTSTLTDYLDPALEKDLRRAIRSRDFPLLAGLSSSWGLQSIPRDGSISEHHVRARLMVVGLVKKYQFPGDAESRRSAAIENFLSAERLCSDINRKLRPGSFDPTCPVTAEIRSILKSILGSLPQEIALDPGCRHGPGSTTSNTSMETSPYFKYGQIPYRVTSRALDHATSLIRSDPRWLGALEDKYRREKDIPMWSILNWSTFWAWLFQVHDENKITTVPKDGLKDRPIAIENNLNVMLQLGVDAYIRKRLLRWGIDLNTQRLNKTLSRLGSMGEYPYATIDLANASDTVSLRAVKLLLPDDWYRYLCDLRSPRGRLPDGRLVRYSKLSSMGNGTTFVVESLIFFAIALAGTRRSYKERRNFRGRIAIHGDDIIVPKDAALCVTRYLRFFGFCVNRDKSFLDGPVKESCGSDWYFGHMVRTIYIKSRPTGVADIYSIRNRLHRWYSLYFPEVDTSALDDYFLSLLGRNTLHTGPYSDEEYASYWHIPKPDRRRVRSSFIIESVVSTSKTVQGCNEFLVRKLMHDLRGPSVLTRKPDEISGGSRFTVMRRVKRTTVICRSFPNWEGSYRHLVELWGDESHPGLN